MKLKTKLLSLSLLALLAACNNEKNVKGAPPSAPKKEINTITMVPVELGVNLSAYVILYDDRIHFLNEAKEEKSVSANGLEYSCQAEIKNQVLSYSIDANGMFATIETEKETQVYERTTDNISNLNSLRGRWRRVDEDSQKRIETTITITKTRAKISVKCFYNYGAN